MIKKFAYNTPFETYATVLDIENSDGDLLYFSKKNNLLVLQSHFYYDIL